jgi:hypothetical protein
VRCRKFLPPLSQGQYVAATLSVGAGSVMTLILLGSVAVGSLLVQRVAQMRAVDSDRKELKGSLCVRIKHSSLDQSPPQHIQSRLRRPPANQLAISGQDKTLVFSVRVVRERDKNQTDRLFFSASVRAGDAGHC